MNVVTGTGGSDELTGTSGADRLYGRGGADRLDGAAGPDELFGEAGDDTLFGQGGADLLDGGSGRDRVDYGDAPSGVVLDLSAGTASGGGGADRIRNVEDARGSGFDDRLRGTEAANELHGRGGLDRLIGLGGGDVLLGHAGNDILRGGDGDDVLTGAVGTNEIDGGNGIDEADYSASSAGMTIDVGAGTAVNGADITDTLIAIERFIGTDFVDTFTGDTGSEHFDGGEDEDILDGGGGADTLVGSAGADTMTGGAGADRFIWNGIADSGPDFADRDTITDFDGAEGDRLLMRRLDADVDAPGQQSFTFIGDAAFSAPGQVRAEVSGGGMLIEATTDSDILAEFSVFLNGLGSLDASAFTF